MTLTNENVNKCVSLLNDFIQEAGEQGLNTGTARLALDQLQRITAGTGFSNTEKQSWCFARPRAETSPETGTVS